MHLGFYKSIEIQYNLWLMSLERYIHNENIGREVDQQRKFGHSPIRAFAEMMINDAKTEMISIDRGSNSPMGSVLSLDRPKGHNQLKTHKRKMEAMIYFGNIIVAMEDTIVNGTYDHKSFISGVNTSLGTYVKYYADFPEERLEKHEDRIDIDELRLAINNDPTFSVVFSYPEQYLPAAIVRILEEQRIYEDVLDLNFDYKNIAQRIATNPENVSINTVQLATLNFFDNFIERV